MAALGVALAGALGAAACDGASDSDSASDDDGRIRAGEVRRFLDRDLNAAATTPVAVTDVRCPWRRTTMDAGTARAACAVTINGTPVELAIERADGELVRHEAVLVVPTLEGFVAGQYETRSGLAVAVDCGAEELLPVAPGSTVACTATDIEGATLTPVVTVEDLDGTVTVDVT